MTDPALPTWVKQLIDNSGLGEFTPAELSDQAKLFGVLRCLMSVKTLSNDQKMELVVRAAVAGFGEHGTLQYVLEDVLKRDRSSYDDWAAAALLCLRCHQLNMNVQELFGPDNSGNTAR